MARTAIQDWPGRALAISATIVLAACGGVPAPAPLDTANTTCATCRMPVSDRHLAMQLVAPGEEPRFFDDVVCLQRYRDGHAQPPGAVVYVTDHRTGVWVDASGAVFSRADSLETPMGSHVMAHADAASRDADPAARSAVAIRLVDITAEGIR
jgi:copper chaperone NosL